MSSFTLTDEQIDRIAELAKQANDATMLAIQGGEDEWAQLLNFCHNVLVNEVYGDMFAGQFDSLDSQ